MMNALQAHRRKGHAEQHPQSDDSPAASTDGIETPEVHENLVGAPLQPDDDDDDDQADEAALTDEL